jgi:hypothetical protein
MRRRNFSPLVFRHAFGAVVLVLGTRGLGAGCGTSGDDRGTPANSGGDAPTGNGGSGGVAGSGGSRAGTGGSSAAGGTAGSSGGAGTGGSTGTGAVAGPPNVLATGSGLVEVFVNGASLGKASAVRATNGAAARPFVQLQAGGAFGKAGTSNRWKAKVAAGTEATDATGPWAMLNFDDST